MNSEPHKPAHISPDVTCGLPFCRLTEREPLNLQMCRLQQFSRIFFDRGHDPPLPSLKSVGPGLHTSSTKLHFDRDHISRLVVVPTCSSAGVDPQGVGGTQSLPDVPQRSLKNVRAYCVPAIVLHSGLLCRQEMKTLRCWTPDQTSHWSSQKTRL